MKKYPMKQMTKNYFEALDKYREDPNRQHKDLLYEAEHDIRERLKMSMDGLHMLYYGRE